MLAGRRGTHRHGMKVRQTIVVAMALSGMLTAGPLAAQPSAEPTADEASLQLAVSLYEAGKYDECINDFAKLLPKGQPRLEDPEVIERARIYYAACLIGAGKVEPAEEQMRRAIRDNPQMSPPSSLVYPQVVVDRFIRVRLSMLDEIEKAEAERLKKAQAAAKAAAARRAQERQRVRRLEQLAQEEVTVVRNSRLIAAIPFGVGQFQNRDAALGYIFFGTELALASTALTSMILQLRLNAQVDAAPAERAAQQRTVHNVLVFSSWGFVGAAAAGVLQAQLAFRPEFREKRRRPLPDDVRRPRPSQAQVAPYLTPSASGLSLGLRGVF